MIRLLEASIRKQARMPDSTARAALAPVPDWLRAAVPGAQTLAHSRIEDMALAAGAGLSLLDATVRREEAWAGVWRQRLALAAAAASARLSGRAEDENQLRDAVLLTRPGDAVGPAGRKLLAWRRLSATPVPKLLSEDNVAGMLDDLGFAGGEDVAQDLLADLGDNAASRGAVAMLQGVRQTATGRGLGPAATAWLADAALARHLGWGYAIPMLGTEPGFGRGASRRHRGIETNGGGGEDEIRLLLAAQARAALRAVDSSAELGRRADRLLAVAPKLRAGAADRVVERLLAEDAMVATQPVPGMSDRGLRRLFDRLVSLNAVRELSGRATFRIYGL